MISEKSPENGDFEISFASPKLFEIFKPIRIVTSLKQVTTRSNIKSKLLDIRFWADLKQLLEYLPSFPSRRANFKKIDSQNVFQ